jgi:spermidine synthase
VLVNEHTNHGIQLVDPALHKVPTGYYNTNIGVGLTLLNYPRRHDAASVPQGLRVGITGLGAGTIATYGLPGDLFRFYEIDPETVRVASGQYGYFSFLSDSRARIEVVEGDGRISLEREPANGQLQNYDVLIVDAFNGDAVPVHLLTRGAVELYLKSLRDEDSVIAVHVSNRSGNCPR